MALVELVIDDALPVTVSRCALLVLPSIISLPSTFVIARRDEVDDDDDDDNDNDDVSSEDWPRLVIGGDGAAYVAWRKGVVVVHVERAMKGFVRVKKERKF